ncbi:MAG: serine hydrolase [Anaerolineae bacterium]
MYSEFVNDHADLKTAIDLLDKWLSKSVHDSHLPGLALGLVHNGDLIWGKGYGYADLATQTPVTLDTRFRIASITKSFTAVAILQLYDAGKLRLDDPLTKYLEWFDLHYPDAPPITIYHCLTHTSGLPRDATVPHWTENDFQDWAEFVATTRQRQPMMPPLQDFSYSNLAYSLLGGVIEAVSGQSWADYVQTQIVAPLNMSDTIVAPDGTEGDFATGYLRYDTDYQREAVPFINARAFSPSASVASTLNDLVKYARFHLSKGQTPILSGYSLREMHRVHWVYPDWSGGYGLGTRTWRIGQWNVSGHTGGYKGFLTMFSVCREHDFGVIVLTNSIDSTPYTYAEQAYKLVLPEIITITAKNQVADPTWYDYVGTYLNDWGNTEVVVRGGQLQMVSLDDLDQTPVVLEPTESDDTFIIRVQGNPGETVRFVRDASGAVVRYDSRNEYAIKQTIS